MKLTSTALAVGMLLSIGLGTVAHAQSVEASTKAQIYISRGASPATLKRQLKQELELKALKNLLEASFAVKFTPDVEAKLPGLVELLHDSIEVSIDPADGEVLSGRATIRVASAKLREYLRNKEIGAGDIAIQSAKILVSIDEFIGVATALDGKTPTEMEVHYSHDKSGFSDTSAKAAGAQSASSSSASYQKNNVAYAARDSVAVAGSQSSAVAAQRSTMVAGQRESGAAYQGMDGSAAAASRSQYAGASNAQYAAAQKSQYAGAASSSRAFADRSQSASARSSSESASFSAEQKNIQQQNDKVSYSVRSKMPEFHNSKPMAQDRVLASRLSGEFQNNGLALVAENDLRSEGGRILPIYEITNNGRINQFVEQIQRKKIEADVWATGQANYTIVGTTATGTQCNGNLSVQGRFIETNQVFFEDSLQAQAVGNGDQDCRARLGIALATSLAKVLGERANKELNARNSRGSVYQLYVYSTTQLKRSDRRQFQDLLETVQGLKPSEPLTKEQYMVMNVQYAGPGGLKTVIDKMLDKLPWDKAEVLSKANKICVGVEGFSACPAEFK